MKSIVDEASKEVNFVILLNGAFAWLLRQFLGEGRLLDTGCLSEGRGVSYKLYTSRGSFIRYEAFIRDWAFIRSFTVLATDFPSSLMKRRDQSSFGDIPASLSSTCMSVSSVLACRLRSQIFVKILNNNASDSFLSENKTKTTEK